MPLYPPTALNPDFGGDYFSAEALAQSSTTSTSFQTKLVLSASTTKAGLFVLNWYVRFFTGSANKEYECQIIDEMATVIGRAQLAFASATQESPFTGFAYLLLPTVGTSKTFTVQFRRVSNSMAVYAENARLAFYKVS